MADPLFSIIIASKNRASTLKRCLESINADDMADSSSELVIVDNGSEDKSLDIIKNFQASALFPVKLFNEARPGLSFCRNTGILNSVGQIIIFTDDDCYLAKDYLTQAQKTFETTSTSFAAGRVLLHDQTDCPIMTCTDDAPRKIDTRSLVGVPKIIGANMIVRRSVINTVGVFDTLFGSGSLFAGDDIDYISRALIKGFTGVYNPDLVVYHHHGRKDRTTIHHQELFYARGIGACYCKRILNHDAGALNALLFAVSKANQFSLYVTSQDVYKEEMLQGARQYLDLFVNASQKAPRKIKPPDKQID
ncbi:MAG: glycosyltransferase family A protein [Pseudomonadota bacterium]